MSDVNTLTAADIRNARSGTKGLGYTWHESEDMHTGYLVKTKIHNSVAHSGGIERLKYELSLKNAQKLLHKQKMYNKLNHLQGDY